MRASSPIDKTSTGGCTRFELYATGQYALRTLAEALHQTGLLVSKAGGKHKARMHLRGFDCARRLHPMW